MPGFLHRWSNDGEPLVNERLLEKELNKSRCDLRKWKRFPAISRFDKLSTFEHF